MNADGHRRALERIVRRSYWLSVPLVVVLISRSSIRPRRRW